MEIPVRLSLLVLSPFGHGDELQDVVGNNGNVIPCLYAVGLDESGRQGDGQGTTLPPNSASLANNFLLHLNLPP
jgi:hypothetical protein